MPWVNYTIKCNSSCREIARLIGRNVSTVSREIRRNCTHMYDIPTYYPHTAQKKYLLRRSYCHRGMFRSQEVIEYIEEKLKATWSPEQIACTPCELKRPRSRPLGSGYGRKRPGQEQGLLRYPGGTQDTLLHCREDAGQTSGDYGECHCRCAVCFTVSRPPR